MKFWRVVILDNKGQTTAFNIRALTEEQAKKQGKAEFDGRFKDRIVFSTSAIDMSNTPLAPTK